MPAVYGSQSKYLIRQEKSKTRLSKIALYLVALISGFGLAATLGLLGNQDVSINFKILSFIISASIFFYVCYKLLFSYSRNERDAKSYHQGSGGEDLVFAELLKLPNDYLIFRDLVISKGNIDFAVVKANQVFSIEVKSHEGRITFHNDQVLRNGYPFREKDFINQTWREGKEVKDYLHKTMGHDVPVTSLLVFSNPKTYVDIDPFKAQKFGVYILHARMLDKFLQSYKGLPVNLNTIAITEFLKRKVA